MSLSEKEDYRAQIIFIRDILKENIRLTKELCVNFKGPFFTAEENKSLDELQECRNELLKEFDKYSNLLEKSRELAVTTPPADNSVAATPPAPNGCKCCWSE
jgi:hypothetical protein